MSVLTWVSSGSESSFDTVRYRWNLRFHAGHVAGWSKSNCSGGWNLAMVGRSGSNRCRRLKKNWGLLSYTAATMFSGGVWPICIKQHGRISKITILLKRHFSLCTRMLCSSYQSKINTVNTKTRITRITMIWNVYKLTIMTTGDKPLSKPLIAYDSWVYQCINESLSLNELHSAFIMQSNVSKVLIANTP